MKRNISIIILLILLTFFKFCTNTQDFDKAFKYLNHHDTVDYVGMDVCISCHSNVHDHFGRTGMGKSFDYATKEKSSAIFNHLAVFDSVLNYYYQPFWRNDSFLILEYRLVNNDTVFKRLEKIDYIIGSGQHTNSHLVDFNGHVYQAPITFYTQRGVWDLAPGFEEGNNSRYTRTIEAECMTCHNAYPKMLEGSANKYEHVEKGIDCERCHGPGELHVALKKGKVKLKDGEQAIIHPSKLTIDEQNSLCQRCHLQGVSVLKEGKSFFDFKPGMLLNEVVDVYMPSFKDANGPFIMASHVERLQKSACFNSDAMSCISCHNPHISVKETDVSFFDDKCMSCHQEIKLTCQGAEKLEGCVNCHMPKSPSLDIPHVAITDHFIRIVDTAKNNKNYSVKELACLNNEKVDLKSKIKAYLYFYEKYAAKSFVLDSINQLLKKSENKVGLFDEEIYYLFIKKDYSEIIAHVVNEGGNQTYDAWTCYRIGEAYMKTKQFKKAIRYHSKSVEIEQYNLNFRNKLGVSYLMDDQLKKALKIFDDIIHEQDKFIPALSNFAYTNMLLGNSELALIFYDKALDLDPDYRIAFLNKLKILLKKEQKSKAILLIEQWLYSHENDKEIKLLKEKLSGKKK